MANYFVSKNSEKDGTHVVHKSRCIFSPFDANTKIYLGTFNDSHDACMEALKHFDQVKGCFFCNDVSEIITNKPNIKQQPDLLM